MAGTSPNAARLLEAAADDGAAIADAPPLAAGVDLADMPDEGRWPSARRRLSSWSSMSKMASSRRSPAASPRRMIRSKVRCPAMPEAVAVVCAAPGPASATSSGMNQSGQSGIAGPWPLPIRTQRPLCGAARVDHSPQSRRARSAPHTVIPAKAGTQGLHVPSLAPLKPGAGSGPALADARSAALEAATRGGSIAASASGSQRLRIPGLYIRPVARYSRNYG